MARSAIVIGAGVIGASVAFRLAQAGVRVKLLEAGRVGAGTSLCSFAWVSACERVGSDDYYRLSLAAGRAHRETVGEFGARGTWHVRPGVIQWRDAECEDPVIADKLVDAKLQRLQELGYPAEALQQSDLRRLEPQLAEDALTERDVAIHYPEDGYIEAPVFIGELLHRAVQQHGLILRSETPVREVLLEGDTVSGVLTSGGERIEADVVVNCGGRWSSELVGQPRLQVPLAPTVGLIAYTPSLPTTIRKVLRTPGLNLRTDGAGRLLLRANDLDAEVGEGDAPQPDHPVAQKLVQRLWKLVPALQGVPVEAVRIAVRPIPQDGLPCVGPIPGISNYWVAVTHGGVNTSAFIGMALRDEILEGRPAAEYAPYRPARFFEKAAA
ncbi:Glycine/D-amino acid oxidase [Nitratireductor aquibiodomus]|jgi:glycine/D-amino acid oxidase-like deaminating enzyme|uniref:Glycine/D-amino acid oxidase n=1 Tax=Nitratireductor aquibiodomus TaxID=204799 RepID=A0A1H4KFH3_9HYPH|nr:FAD-binding oxidoreductase [Nitratireductor aquibiodomus]SEB57133.1 Glycine/D-amino acid oxidase [Nitratireductor aquibiodomus]